MTNFNKNFLSLQKSEEDLSTDEEEDLSTDEEEDLSTDEEGDVKVQADNEATVTNKRRSKAISAPPKSFPRASAAVQKFVNKTSGAADVENGAPNEKVSNLYITSIT